MDNKMKTKMLRLTIVTLSTVIAFILFNVLPLTNFSQSSAIENVEQDCSPDMLANKFIELMKTGNFTDVENCIKTSDWGYNPDFYNYEAMNDSVGIVSMIPEYSNVTGILKKQADFINSSFGATAWNNATYEIKQKNCPSCHEQYIDASTNTPISEKEYLEIDHNYWVSFTKERGLDYNEFFIVKEYSGESSKNDKMNILIALEMGFGPSLKIDLVDDYNYYEVYFNFNGQSVTESGEHDFSIIIDNKNGEYEISRGLCWIVPLSEKNSVGD